MRVFLLKISKIFGVATHYSAETTKASTIAPRARWLKGDSPYDELNDAGASLWGDTARDTHNNSIALALNRRSENTTAATSIAENEIRVTKDVVVESLPPPVVPKANLPKDAT